MTVRFAWETQALYQTTTVGNTNVYSKKKWTWRGGGVPREAAVVTIVGAEP